ncbi:MAG: transposase [Planctomycetes bacterium]|nr:transposase [Planctomycetota bacterium]
MQVDTQKFIGLDVDKKSIAIAVAEGGPYDEIFELGVIPHDLPRLLRKLEPLGEPARLHVAYEAGPTGYGLARALKERGIDCIVVAPSRTPQRSGERVKTDRRDAVKLARYLRSNELVPIEQPSCQREALRDLVRAREDVMRAQHKARQQLQSFLLRHGRTWDKKSSWTGAHLEWIRS